MARPGEGILSPDALIPFEAEYEQLGFAFDVRLTRTVQERPIWSFQMIVNGPNGVEIDHVGHYADDLSFAYRRFGFRAYRNEYVEAESGGDSLRVRRLPRDDVSVPWSARAVPLSGPVVDGTFMFWLLGTLPLSEGAAWRMPTWQLTSDSLDTRLSAELRVTGRDSFVTEEGTPFDAWIVETESGQGTVRIFTVDRPPYLLRQDVVGPDGEVTRVIVLRRVSRLASDH